ncbi:hypothetical protein FRB98_003633 [Tulasnella sp. 332]|nr:hypothetical protein FRB98_003633 [Tulasnella sp. 332]
MLSAFRTYMRGNVDKLALQDAGRVVGPTLAEQILGSWSQAPDVPLLPSPVLPAEPSVLYVRDGEVNDVTRRLTSTAGSTWLALLGPGGIGKTAILLAIRDHALVAQKYGDCRYFVRCEQATSTTLLVEFIARSLRLETSSSDRMKDVMTLLRKADHPILLIVDNFETPRDVEGEQSRRTRPGRAPSLAQNRGLHNFVSFRLKPYGDVYIKNPSKIRGQQVPRRVARRALLQAFGCYAHGRSRKTRYNADGALEGVEG